MPVALAMRPVTVQEVQESKMTEKQEKVKLREL
jgi:hypothetical protein